MFEFLQITFLFFFLLSYIYNYLAGPLKIQYWKCLRKQLKITQTSASKRLFIDKHKQNSSTFSSPCFCYFCCWCCCCCCCCFSNNYFPVHLQIEKKPTSCDVTLSRQSIQKETNMIPIDFWPIQFKKINT